MTTTPGPDSRPSSSTEVRAVGRIGTRARSVTMPSGDVVVEFVIVVDRPPGRRRTRVTVDAIPCVAGSAAIARRANTLKAGTWVEATGVLRRRFWRAGSGVGSAMQVEVRRLVAVRTRATA